METKLNKRKKVEKEVLIGNFKHHLKLGVDHILRACEIYVQALDKYKEVQKEFEKIIPEFSKREWSNLEKVGRKQLIPELLFVMTPAAKKLKQMPLSAQKQIYGKTIPMVTHNGDTLNVNFDDMSTKQARQAFAANHVRSLSEQRAWIETNITKQKEKPAGKYEIKNGKVIFYEKTECTKDDLIHILARM